MASAEEMIRDERQLGSQLIDAICESDWFQRRESVVAAKVLASVEEYQGIDETLRERIQDEWGVDDDLLSEMRLG